MDESKLTRRNVLKNLALVGAAVPLQLPTLVTQNKPQSANGLSTDVSAMRLYVGEPSIGEPGYEKRVAKLFENASSRDAAT